MINTVITQYYRGIAFFQWILCRITGVSAFTGGFDHQTASGHDEHEWMMNVM